MAPELRVKEVKFSTGKLVFYAQYKGLFGGWRTVQSLPLGDQGPTVDEEFTTKSLAFGYLYERFKYVADTTYHTEG